MALRPARVFLLRANRPVEALRIAKLEVTRRHDAYTLDAYAWALSANGKNDEAHTNIERALSVGLRDAQLLYRAGAIAARSGDVDAAGNWLKTRGISRSQSGFGVLRSGSRRTSQTRGIRDRSLVPFVARARRGAAMAMRRVSQTMLTAFAKPSCLSNCRCVLGCRRRILACARYTRGGHARSAGGRTESICLAG